MKRIVSALLALLCLLVSLPVLCADAIWEPQDDFYQKHWENCTVEQKQYTTNEAVDGVKSPESNKVVVSFGQGESVNVLFTYTDESGVLWGDCEQYNEQKELWESFWLPMEKLTKVYDSEDFLCEHQSELQPVTEAQASYTPTGTVPLWNYPGAGDFDCCFDASFGDLNLEGYDGYTDEQGNLWVYIPYYEGLSGWLYMSDPESTEPHALSLSTASVAPTKGATAAPTVSAALTAAPTASAAPTAPEKADKLLLRVVIFSVVLVVLLSALLIVMIFRRKKK